MTSADGGRAAPASTRPHPVRYRPAMLVRRFDDLRLESDAVEWGPSLFRVPGRLPVTFRAA